ncbi:hypothetical protein D6D29_04600 [Aureobasidium pullulans]|nr:hypothetical protein D6D29_04600 [Aureobasidium pullulans]THY17183.1 hypothetical protein D6D00_08609 [Aureobasidium pullulans]TIA18007.1 hypothetical protein D6C81_05299 [Aureobasidium pullulans]
MTRKHRVKRGLQPHNPKETRIKTLVSYLGARIKECKRRPSISPCAYSAYDKDFDDEFEDNEFSDLDWLRNACSELYQLLVDDNFGPYIAFSRSDLAQCLQQRQIRLPKLSNRKTYAGALQKADAELRFRFLDLPKDVRLKIYHAALLNDMAESQCVYHGERQTRRNMIKPPLLQTCRQIYLEATPIFYHINRFPLECSNTSDLDFAARTKCWLSIFENAHAISNHINDILHITLIMQCCKEHPIDHVKIDLGLRNSKHWFTCTKRTTYKKPLRGCIYRFPDRLVCHDRTLAPLVSLARWSKKIVSDDCSSDESEIDDDDPGESSSGEAAKDRPSKGMKMSAENFAAAEVAVDELWKTCGQSGHMVLTHDGLQKLCEAVQKIANDMCRRA